MLVLAPWEKLKSFTRAWCLLEIMTTLDAGAELDIALSPDEHKGFLTTLNERFDNIIHNINTIEAKEATATVLKDKESIFKLIEEGKGFDVLNDAVMTTMRTWLIKVITTFRAECKAQDPSDVYPIFPNARTGAVLGRSIAALHQMLGQHDAALEAYGEVLKEDPDDPETIKGIVLMYVEQERWNESLKWSTRLLEVRHRTHEENDIDFATTLYRLALSHEKLGQYAESAASYDSAGDVYLKVFSHEHEATMRMKADEMRAARGLQTNDDEEKEEEDWKRRRSKRRSRASMSKSGTISLVTP